MSNQSSHPWTLEEEDGVLICTLVDDNFELPVGRSMQKELLQYLEGSSVQKVLVNMQTISFISSGGFSILISISNRIKKLGGRFGVCNLQPKVYDLMVNVLSLYHVIEIYNYRQNAMLHLTKK